MDKIRRHHINKPHIFYNISDLKNNCLCQIVLSLSIVSDICFCKPDIGKSVNISDCIFCHCSVLKKYGTRYNKSDNIQRFLCSNCKRTFSINIRFEKMKKNYPYHLFFIISEPSSLGEAESFIL
jgi:hypothetical protein